MLKYKRQPKDITWNSTLRFQTPPGSAFQAGFAAFEFDCSGFCFSLGCLTSCVPSELRLIKILNMSKTNF